MRGLTPLLALVAAALAGGCASPGPVTARGQAPARFAAARGDDPDDQKKDAAKAKDGDGKKNGEEKKEDGDKKDKDENGKDKKKDKGPPKALFEWAIGPEEEDKPDEEDWIETDRPDFTESSKTVGLGRVQLEAGYTYYRDRTGGATRIAQTYPEALLRIGMFADWFELRLGQQWAHVRTTAFGAPTEHTSGLDDLYVGAKVALTEQKGYLPETALIIQALVPAGIDALSANKVVPGLNFCYGWDVIPDFLSLGGGLQANAAVDDQRHGYVELAQSLTVGYTLTKQLGAFTEWYAFYPTGTTSPGVTDQHYFDAGFTYKVTPDFQLDVRAGWGLSRHSDDFFAGAGFAVRY